MPNNPFLINLGIALAAALAGGLLARLCRLPVIMGYLLAGVFIGPHTPGVYANRHTIEPVAELGVALLMFAVGVHFSLRQLRPIWRPAVLGGVVQIIATIFLGLAVGVLLGWGLFGGIFLGCALALSSTAVMMKILEDRGEQQTEHGRILLGTLLVQDLSLIVMMALLPAFGKPNINATATLSAPFPVDVLVPFLRAAAILSVTLVLTWRIVPAFLHLIARTNSKDLFILTIVCLCMGAALITSALGLGLELGAFIAGIIISETDYAHEVLAQIRPLRDVLASLFFVSVGMLFNPMELLRHWGAICLILGAIIVGKSVLSIVTLLCFRQRLETALRVGFGLAQIGEFTFVLTLMGTSKGLISGEEGDILLAAALVSLLLSPILYAAAAPIAKVLHRRRISSMPRNGGNRGP